MFEIYWIGAGEETAGFALLRCGVLEASSCARPRSAKLALTGYRVWSLKPFKKPTSLWTL